MIAALTRGRAWLWILLVASVLAALWPQTEHPDNTVLAAKPRADTPAATARPALRTREVPSLDFLPWRARLQTAESRRAHDLFSAHSWQPKVSLAPETMAPPAPKLPFTYGGSYQDGQSRMVYLMDGSKLHTVRTGDTVNATFRVDAIDAAAVTFIHLPTDTPLTLSTRSVQP